MKPLVLAFLVPCWLLCSTISLPAVAGDDDVTQKLTLYQANFSPDRMMDILRFNNPQITGSSRLTALAYTREIGGNPNGLSWEVEAQAVQHSGIQSHQEVNALLSMRWNRFPWDAFVNTSVAFGSGLSYAFVEPDLEPRTSRPDEDSSRLLNYLLVEVDLSPPRSSNWGLVLRLHHRSGVFGMYNGVNGGSNFVGAGLRYTF